MGTGSFSGIKTGRGVTLTTHHLLVLLVMKGTIRPMSRTAYTEPQCLYNGALIFTFIAEGCNHQCLVGGTVRKRLNSVMQHT
jgi:hypothetical protein